MLEPWSWQHKRLKKVIAWYAYQRRDLKACASIHATSEMEAKTISKLGLKCPTWTIPNGIVWPEQVPSLRKTKILQNGDEHTRTAVFLGRLYPVKGLPLLLDAWAKVRPSGWQLKLVGPDEANHADLLKQLIKKLNLSGVVFLVGPLEGHDKWRTLYSSDLFVCPSYTENFGMAIAEAMACGLPVITTTGTPWKSIADQGLGWWVPPEPDSLSQALAESTRCTTSELSEMGERARAFVSKNFAWKEIGNTMLTKYQALCDNRNAGWVKKHGIYGR
jgi:glycosyltransferase involved in cell wall biosynthesis